MASFTNLALSASSLGTKYLNQVFTVSREVVDPLNDKVLVAADYSSLGILLITVTILGLLLPLGCIFLVKKEPSIRPILFSKLSSRQATPDILQLTK